MNFNKIKELQSRFNLSDTEMSRILGYKRSQSYSDLFAIGSMKVAQLEKLVSHFNVPYGFFFDEHAEYSEMVAEKAESYSLKNAIDEKNKQIEFLKHRVEYFENLVNELLKTKTSKQTSVKHK